jgi:hypothetical protein
MTDRVCSVDKCDKKHKGHGLCDTHLKRQRKGLSLKKQYRNPNGSFVECKIDGCTDKSTSLGMCPTHYHRIKKYGNPDTVLHVQAKGKLSHADVWVTYRGAHTRVERSRGKAKDMSCAWSECQSQADEWAYDNNDPNEVTNIVRGCERRYSLLPEHYMPLCKKHHELYDMMHRNLKNRL